MFIHSRLLMIAMVSLVILMVMLALAVRATCWYKDQMATYVRLSSKLLKEKNELQEENQRIYKLSFNREMRINSEGEGNG